MRVDRAGIAAGHEATADAAEHMLRAGGNAYDAACAAFFMACVAEPVLASIGGGGFLLASPAGGDDVVVDFFTQTPLTPAAPEDLDFEPLHADFGSTTQEFHVGLGAIATPGCVKGMFEINRRLGRMPMRDVVGPAVGAARAGLEVTPFQAFLASVIKPIYLARASSRAVFGSRVHEGDIVGAGERLAFPALADVLETMAIEGEGLFYRGEIASIIAGACAAGGMIGREDLRRYEVTLRRPLAAVHGESRVLTNPLPSSGGTLAVFGLGLMAHAGSAGTRFGAHEHLRRLADAMELTNEARAERATDDRLDPVLERVGGAAMLARYRESMAARAASRRGTTHVSIVDAQGNAAALTVSNGEGCGEVLPGLGFMLNNMMGEEDLNPGGFHRWVPDTRMSSMMMPTVVIFPDGTRIATGSGGSNRIRTALLQVLINLIDFGQDVETAVTSPRIHFERGTLYVEPGFETGVVERLMDSFPDHRRFEALNLFFGGAHTVSHGPGGTAGAGDPRRGGVGRVL